MINEFHAMELEIEMLHKRIAELEKQIDEAYGTGNAEGYSEGYSEGWNNAMEDQERT